MKVVVILSSRSSRMAKLSSLTVSLVSRVCLGSNGFDLTLKKVIDLVIKRLGFSYIINIVLVSKKLVRGAPLNVIR